MPFRGPMLGGLSWGGHGDWSKMEVKFPEGGLNTSKKELLGRPGAQEAIPWSNTRGMSWRGHDDWSKIKVKFPEAALIDRSSFLAGTADSI